MYLSQQVIICVASLSLTFVTGYVDYTQDYTIRNKHCLSPCSHYGYTYNWCRTNSGWNWDYCSPQRRQQCPTCPECRNGHVGLYQQHTTTTTPPPITTMPGLDIHYEKGGAVKATERVAIAICVMCGLSLLVALAYRAYKSKVKKSIAACEVPTSAAPVAIAGRDCKLLIGDNALVHGSN